MHLLDRFTLEGRNVSDRSGPTYAPKKFAEEEEAKAAKASKARLAAAMRRLFVAKQIRAEEYGRSDNPHRRLVRASQGGLSCVASI
jgi:hypothetical protein